MSRPAARCRVLALLVVVLGTLLSLVAAGPARADGEVNIDHIAPPTSGGEVSVLLGVEGIPLGSEPDLDSVSVTLDETPVAAEAELYESGVIERTTILALDSSVSMRGEEFAAAQAAALGFLEAAPADVEIGLVAFAADQQITPPTTDRAAVAAAIEDIELSLGTRVYDAVIESVQLAGQTGARSVLLLSDGKDRGGGATIGQAIDAATEAGVVVDVVALDQPRRSRALLERMANATGGEVLDAAPASLAAAFDKRAEALAGQLLVTFRPPSSTPEESELRVSIDAGGTTYSDTALLVLPPTAVGPRPVEPRQTWFGQPALWLGAAALTMGLAVIVSIALLDASRRPTLAQRQLAHYGSGGSDLALRGGLGGATLRETAVAATERVVRGDFETRLSQRLSGAGSRLTAAEWLLLHVGVALSSALVGLVLRGAALAFLFLILGAVAPWLWLAVRHSRRLAAFHAQLPDTLQLLASSLSAGLSMPQSVDTAVREGAEPMTGELRRALIEQRLGVQIDDALEGVAERMDSQDFGWVVMAIRIQREVGGNLSELLNTVAETLREREFLRRQVKVLTAEGRFSAWVLGLLPVVMFGYMLVARPDYVRPLYTEPTGVLLLGLGVVLLLVGGILLSRMVRIEV